MVKGNGKAITLGNGGGLDELLLDTLTDFSFLTAFAVL